ncbi:hybrid non-ribosomal peptide synthetase/type I polyketide synthase [Nocardiopsis kunsanensis]|uniref:hybrid non-ribosomal peptide synthetase/type I polyketide synthase n=1 Tax=Nocardiopsis kunsanensis TaxID=141693 RepID=UPI0003475A02|nr:hybrid non-ribosomal peptide synthetase/type I polyketide synthase [Nocardiopsis kunsanensis]
MRELELLHELRAARVLVWAKDNGRIGFSHDKESGFPEELRQRVGESKEALLELLRINGVDSRERARATTVYKVPTDRSARRPLFSIQRGMYLQGRIDELGYTYTIPLAVELPNAEPDLAERAVRALLDVEPILRTRVYDDLTQDTRPTNECAVARRTVGAGELDAWHEDRARRAFPLADGGLVLPEVVTAADRPGVVVGLTHHHMLSDAYSVDVLADRLAELYDLVSRGETPGTSTDHERPLDYFDHTVHQRIELRAPQHVRARSELEERLARAEKLQLGRARGGNRAETTTRRLGRGLRRSLSEFAREHRISEYSVLFTGLHHVLTEFAGGQSGFAIATTVGNRPAAFESAVGPFITTLPVVPEHRPDASFADNARDVHEAVVHLNEHHQLNLDMLASALPGGAADLADVVRVLFTMHNFAAAPTRARTRYSVLPYRDQAEKFGISVIAKDEGEDVSFTVTYAAERYDGELVEALLDAYLVLLRSLVSAPADLPIGQLALVDPRLLGEVEASNRTAVDHGAAESAVALFEEQARRTPDGVAVVYRDTRLSYRELDERANRLARVLLEEHGLARQSLVCLVMDRSEHLLVAILAVLKAGCAYVPVDPDLPEERVRFILGDTATPLVLTEGSRADSLAEGVPVIAVDSPGLGADRSPLSPGAEVGGDDIAYAIYTSGTTGRPKGVLCEHRGLVNRILWMNRRFPLGESDRVLQKTPYSFDVSVWELLWANWFGAAVVFAEPGGHRDPEYLAELVERERVTVLHFVPSMLAAFTDALRAPGAPHPSSLDSLRYLFCSGEELRTAQVRDVHELLPWVEPHNLYGPTEASIDVTHFDCTDRGIGEVRLGRPIDNMRVHVLSSSRKPLPPYAIGELYLGGVGLARGYLGLPELTEERFVPDPLMPGERLYRTGDLGTRLGDGDIVFLGRNDFQVKVNGFRVELGEVEAALERHPEVRRSVVVFQRGMLVGYYAADRVLEAELHDALRAALPDHAVPAALVRLDELPVTANGKLDRAALPASAPERDGTVTGPSDEREAVVRDLCADILGVEAENLSVSADMSHLGMDSLAAIRLTGYLRQRLGLPVTVRDVFAHRTVERLHAHLRDVESAAESEVPVRAEQGRLEGPVRTSPIQNWFLSLPLTDRRHWNQAFLVRTPELSLPRLAEALQALVEHHDAFRLRFPPDGPAQHYDPEFVHAGLNLLDVRGLPGEEGSAEFSEALDRTLTAWQRGFDLVRGPLHAFGYLHGFNDGSAWVFLALHHLIVDGVSQRILTEDLRTLYEGGQLGDKGTSYRQWTEALAAHTAEFELERPHWDALAEDAEPQAALVPEPGEGWRSTGLSLDEERTALLLGDCNRAHRTTTEDLLMTALGRALRELTGDDTHHVLREGHGREDFAAGLDVTRTVGWFTSLSPFRLRVTDDLDESLRTVKEDLRGVPRRGLSYGPLLGYTDRPLPPVWFNYLGQAGGGADAWEPVAESAGDPMPDGPAPGAALAVLVSNENGRLRLRLDSKLGATRTEALRASLERALADIVDSCGDRGFVRYTPSDFRDVRGEDDLRDLPAVPGSDPHGWFPLTDLQQAYLVGRFGGYEIGNVANHVYTEHVYPDLDIDRLETAVNRLIAECDVLRTVFSLERMGQRVLAPDEVPHYSLPVHRFTEHDEDLLDDVRERLSHEVHDAERFPLFAFEVSVLPDRRVLHTSFDLLPVDVHSRLALLRRLNDLYRGTDERRPLPAATFKDYQDHVELLRHSRWYEQDREYWSGKLADMPPRCSLPFRVPPDAVVHPRFAEHTEHVDAGVWKRFKDQATQRGLSPSAVLLSLFGSVLAYFSGSTEFPITVTVARRLPVLPDVKDIPGNFTSTVLHHFVDDPRDAERLARRTHDVLWEDVTHSLYSGVAVQRDLARTQGLETAKAVSPIVFTGAVGSDTRDFEGASHLRDDEVVPERYWEAQTSQAWIDLQVVETADGFSAKWLYVEQLFHRKDIAHFNRLFLACVERLAEGGWERGLPRHLYLPDEDRALIAGANSAEAVAEVGTSAPGTLFGAHEEWCRSAGARERTAVVDAETGEHTHGELVERSGLLARSLPGREEELVAVLAQKGYLQVLATTAVMRSGSGYLPLHVDWPVARMSDILRQAGVRTVLLSRDQYERSEVREGLEEFSLLVLEELAERAPGARTPADTPLPEVGPDDIAYVIFTSGSTGRPKGVTISHRGALNTILAVNERLDVGPDDRVLALSELSFDLSVYDLFGVLAAGGTVVFPDQERVKDPAHWVELVQRHRITLWNSVPQLAGLLVEEAEVGPARIDSLRAVLMSGDWIPTTLPDRIRNLCRDAVVLSLGGATEGSIWSVWYEIGRVDPAWPSIPYGVAMPGQRMYVLTAAGEHAPVGVPGEIHIGGAGVALNYWRAPEITAERYVDHPELGRLYRTGDLGCWRREGYIEFLGRVDFQVKLNGYRVELGEIESALVRHPRISQAVAVVHDTESAQSLVGYYVADTALDSGELRALLAERLPAYMVPELMLHLTELPLSPNGKLDRSALPEPGGAARPAHDAPYTLEQVRIRDLWADVLGIRRERLGVRDDLLRAGVDSIVAIRMASRLRRELGIAVGVRDVFTHRTVESFCERVLPSAASEVAVRAEQGVLTGAVPALPMQSWFDAQCFPRPHHWNQSFLISVPRLDTDRLRDAVGALVERHDALRLRRGEDGLYFSADTTAPPLRLLDVGGLGVTEDDPGFATALDEVLTDWQAGFDLANGPLMAIGYLHGFRDGGARVFLAVHHLAVDGVSWRILVEDLRTAYEGGDPGAKSTSVRQWAEALAERAALREHERSYWEALETPVPAVLRQDEDPREIRIDVDPEFTRKVLHDCPRFLRTGVHEFLLTAFARALGELTGVSEHGVVLEGHGREDIASDLDVTRTVGWFASLHPCRVRTFESVVDSLVSVKEALRSVPGNGIDYGSLVGYGRPLPAVCFNYLGQVDDGAEDAWRITDEPAGTALHPDNVLPYAVNLAGMVVGGRLRFRMTTRLSETDTARLTRAFESALADLVTATADQPRTYLTSSDVEGVLPQRHLDRLQADGELDDVLLATGLQQGLVAHAVRQGGVDDAYRVQAVWDYHSELDPDLLRGAWEHAQRTFGCLRTRFDWRHELVQVVSHDAELDWEYTDLTGHDDPESAFDAMIAADRATPYDLEGGALFRVRLARFGECRFACLLNTHHAVLDGWSSPLLLDAVHSTYRALRDGHPLPEPVDHAPDAYLYLQRHPGAHDEYWRRYVSDAEEQCDLNGLLRPERRPFDLGGHTRVEEQRRETLAIDADRLERIRGTASQGGVTLNAVIQYAWHRVLATYGNCATTVVGTVLAGRDLPVEGIDRAVGLFLSTVPLIVRHGEGDRSLLEAVRALQHDIQEANTHSTVDLATLQPSVRRLFDTLFIYENYPGADGPGTEEPRPIFRFRHQKRDYPLVVSVIEDGGGIGLALDYAGELVSSATARRLLTALESILVRFGEEPGLPAGQLGLADRSDIEHQRAWNETGTAEPTEPLIHRAFEEHAARTPEAPAVEWDGGALSYERLNTAANRLAHRLLRATGGGAPVLLLLDRGPDLMVGLLAVLKSGGAYIPIDPNYPDERVSRVVSGSGAHCVVTQGRHEDRLANRFPGLERVRVDDPDHVPEAGDDENPRPDMTGDEPAYIIYTSGSTGQPKGVVVEHRSVTATVRAVRERHFPGMGPLRTVSMTNYVFDIFGLEYGLTLLGGGSMVLGEAMAPELDCAGLDFVQMTPTLLEMKRDVVRNGAATRLLVGGEALDRRLLTAVLPKFAEVVNVYGPTETTIWSTSAAYRAGTDDHRPVTIGRALPGEGAHVLGRGMLPLPVGAVGELHLSGCGLARGYAGDPELTEARFVRGPDGRRLYRTGDLVRWLASGEIEYLGRVDNQVKLRGHRLDLGEVESAMTDFPGVRSGVARVIAPAGADRAAARLVGYYVPEPGAEVDEAALAGHLSTVLPEHARPAALVRLAELPLNHSGKLDVRALPVPASESAPARSGEPPRGGLAAELARVWCDVLGRDRVDVHDRFFELGGNSVLLTKLHGRLPETIRDRIRINDLFTYPTIASLTRYLEGTPESVESPDVSAPGTVDEEAIAVIGMACRLPDADDVAEYWRNLRAGHCSIVHHSRDELLDAGVPEELLDHPGYVRAQSALRDIRGFDAEFFGYSRREANTLDPQHRVFLECAWHALEDAFCDPRRYQGAIGLFAGAGHNAYLDEHVRPVYGPLDPSAEYQAMINNRPDFLATKVAYRLNLSGPAMTVQTACSSSLVAVHQAVTALLAGDCDVALAGGVSIGQLGRQGYLHQDGMVFSADGFCRPFDADAQGTVEGQGAGLVVLKPLARALADGDSVRAVIKGSAINNDGHDKVGYTAPSTQRQAAVIRAAHRRAGVDPATIGYVETHGTGTALGDPIEFAALRDAFGASPGSPRALGAVKANIGHLDAASGVVGLIKAVLCLENRTLVPTPHHRVPNPELDIDGSGFFVNTECLPWKGDVLRAGVSSFGIGGTNAHLVLESAPPMVTDEPHRRDERMLVVSGRSAEAVRDQARALSRHLAENPEADLDQVGYTLLTARARFSHSRVVVGADRRELIDGLDVGEMRTVPHRDGRPVAFLFPGQGAQYRDMGSQLYQSEAAYRFAVDECAAVLSQQLPGVSVDDLLGRGAAVHDPRFTQPALFVTEYALARWLTSLGVRPAAMIGHSLGEYVAACLAGVFSPQDALRLVCERGRIAADSAPGAMLAVPLPAERALSYGSDVDLAAVNEADSCVVAGDPEAVDRFAAALAAEGMSCKRLPVRRAFHSRLLEPGLGEFERAVERIGPKPPTEPFISTLTGDWADPADVTRPAYWVRHLREPVAFAAALDTLHASDRTADALLVEVGPGRTLTRLARKHPRRDGGPVVATLPDREREQAGVLAALGTVHAAGADIDASALYGLGPADRVRLPGYAFQRAEHWADPAVGARGPAVAEAPPNAARAGGLPGAVEEAWRAVLGVEEVGPEDDFFEQGGDSLAAVQLVSRIERATGVRVELLELPRRTPAALLEHLRSERTRAGSRLSARTSSVVRVARGAPEVPPLVLVHPVGGDVYFYRELAQLLPERQPVFAIRSPMFDGLTELDTVERMADHYLDLLDDLGVGTPYRLGGASFGGIVAYEMAQRTAEQTSHAPDLVLIDSPAPGHLPAPMSDAEILHYLVRYGIPPSVCRVGEIEALDTLDAKIDHLAERSRGTAFEEMLSADFLPRYLRVWQRHTQAMHRYAPKPYRGDVRFYSHTEVIPDFPTGQDRHWRRLALGGWRHTRVPGNHLSMNATPHVARIAEDLADLAIPAGPSGPRKTQEPAEETR